MTKKSVSSVLAEQRRQRATATSSKAKVHHVKFTPEEMAYDPTPEETANWTPVGRGPGAIFAKPPGYGQTVELEPDIAAVFKDSAAANRALRKLIEAVPVATERKRKSA